MVTADSLDQFVEVAGARIHLLKGGRGKPVVFLHSVEGNLGWLNAHQQLARQSTVYVPTHPGFGQSERPEWLENVGDLAHFYLWFLQEMGLEKVTLAGHFLGGWLAAEMAIRCPHSVDRLILIDAAGIRPKQAQITDIFLHGVKGTRDLSFFDPTQVPEYPALFDHELSPDERELLTQNQEMAARLTWKPYMANRTLPALLPRLRVPTLIVWGRDDRIVPLECGEAYQAAIPGARLAVLDRCGHLPHVERPDEFSRVVNEFLAAP